MVFYIDITVKEIFTAIQVWYANFISKEVVLLGAAGKFLEIYADLSLKVPIFCSFLSLNSAYKVWFSPPLFLKIFPPPLFFPPPQNFFLVPPLFEKFKNRVPPL